MPSNLRIIKTAIFISGRGSNMKSLIKYSKKKNSKIEITKVFSNNKTAKGIETATKLNVPEIFYYSKKSFDGQGNITIGIKDHIIFPEISVENVENIFGFDITIATSANNDKEGYELLKLMNFPFLN